MAKSHTCGFCGKSYNILLIEGHFGGLICNHCVRFLYGTLIAPDNSLQEIRERWKNRKWPSIGYFVHGQAYEDIQKLLKMLEGIKQ